MSDSTLAIKSMSRASYVDKLCWRRAKQYYHPGIENSLRSKLGKWRRTWFATAPRGM